MSEDSQELVNKYLDNELDLEELEDAIGAEDAEAVKASQKQLRKAGDLADELSRL